MVSKVEEAPAVRCGESLTVLHSDVEDVVCAVEISSSGWFGARSIRKVRVETQSQFFNQDGAFGKGTGFEVDVQVLLLDVDMVVFREVGFAVVEGIGRQRGTDKSPVAIAHRQLQLSVGIKHSCGLRSGRNATGVARQVTPCKYSHP